MYKMIHHSFAYMIARGVPGVINVIALAIYTRLLTAEEYGRYAIALSITVFVYSTLFQWLNLSLSRFFSGLKNKNQFLKSILSIFVCLIFFTAITAAISIFISNNDEWRYFIGICTVFLWAYAWFELTLELIRCRLAPIRYGMISIIKAILALLISVVWVSYSSQTYGILLGTIISIAVVSFLFLWKDWKSSWTEKKDSVIIKEIISYGVPLIPTTSLTVVVMSADRLLLGWFLGAREAGLYSTSYDLTNSTMTLLLMAVSLAGYPLLTKALEYEDRWQTRAQLHDYFHLLLAVGVPSAAGFAVLAPNIAFTMLGKEFCSTATILIPWISLMGLIMSLKTYYFDLSFQLGKNTKKLIWISVCQVVISLGLNFLLIPYYAKMSLIYSGLVASTIGCSLSFFLGRKVFLLPVFSWETVKIFLATLGMIATLWPIRYFQGIEYLVLQIMAGGVSYLIIGFIFNILNFRKKWFLLKEVTMNT